MIVHLVSANSSTVAALKRFSARAGSPFELRRSQRVSVRLRDDERACVVLDLTLPQRDLVRAGGRTPDVQYVLLVRPGHLVPSEWLEFVHQGETAIVGIDPGRADPFIDLFACLERWADGITPAEIAAAIITANERLRVLERSIRAVFEHPWQIRKPRDFTKYASVSTERIHELCGEIGLKRVEHLITLVRALGLEYLIVHRRLSLRRARMMVGIGDPSNFRRQMRRARYFKASA